VSAAADVRKFVTEVHVIPDERTAWRVYDRDADAPLSEHTSATEAELAAQALAQDRDADRVVVHDRYNRTRDAAPSPAGCRHASSAPARASWRSPQEGTVDHRNAKRDSMR
jgi:uncharacterized protein DUF2188